MEKIPHSYNWDNREPKDIKKQLSAKEHIFIFNKGGSVFEEHSYVFEPIEAYEADLKLLEESLARRTHRLAELQQQIAINDAPQMNVAPAFAEELAQRIAFERQQIDFWRRAKAQTAWLFAEAVRQNSSEVALLDSLSDDIQH